MAPLRSHPLDSFSRSGDGTRSVSRFTDRGSRRHNDIWLLCRSWGDLGNYSGTSYSPGLMRL